MKSIATLGPVGSDSYQAAKLYAEDVEPLLFHRIVDVLTAFIEERVQYAIIPVYNTREGEVKDYFRPSAPSTSPPIPTLQLRLLSAGVRFFANAMSISTNIIPTPPSWPFRI